MRPTHPPHLLVLSGPSGVGKTTLAKKLLARYPRLQASISTTTRKPRNQEHHGKDYYFVSREEFQQKITAGFFAEWAQVHDQFYGTSLEPLHAANTESQVFLLEIDVQGARKILTTYDQQCYLIFIHPPDLATLAERLRRRSTESPQEMEKRLQQSQLEINDSHFFHTAITNHSLEQSFRELCACVEQELHLKPLGGGDQVLQDLPPLS